MKITTLCYPLKDGQVLLAMKKRGFGIGKWNGPGGKAKEGETVEDACRRETFEETGVNVGELEDRGVIEFVFEEKPDWDQECRIFVTSDVSGEPVESEEMIPRWFDVMAIPLAEMWEDDPIWLPQVLAGGTVRKRFYFDDRMRMLRNEDM